MKKSSEQLHTSSIVLTVCAFDQILKAVAPLLGFEVSLNSGISFSLFQSLPVFIVTVTLVILLVLICIVFQNIWRENIVASGLFFGGSVSNIIDRVLYSAVRDWIPVPLFNVKNNLADWAIFLALLLIIYRYSSKESVK